MSFSVVLPPAVRDAAPAGETAGSSRAEARPATRVQQFASGARGLLLAFALLPHLAGCDRPDQRPDVVLVTLDTVRADAIEALPDDSVLRRLQAEGVCFSAAITPTPLTLPAHTTLMSGLDPNRHGVRNNGLAVPADLPTLATLAAAAGYRTAAFVSAFPLDPQFGLDAGFAHYDAVPAAGAASALGLLERDADATTARVLDWLPRAEANRPLLLWVHYFDAHAPYLPPDLPPSTPERERYLGELRRIDRALGELLKALDARGTGRLLLVVADHGEGLGDHGEPDHGLLLHESTLRVPMIWHAPERWPAREVPATARLADVLPSLLDALGLDAPAELDGVSLLPSLHGGSQAIPPAYAETFYGRDAYGAAPLHSLREDNHKLIASRARQQLFDLDADPGEAQDLAEPQAALADRLAYDVWARPEPDRAAAPVDDPVVLARLQSLGYLGGVTAQPDTEAPHPADLLGLHRELLRIQALAGGGDRVAALSALDALRDVHPEQAFPAYLQGALLREAGRGGAAAAALAQAVELAPRDTQSRFLLGETLMQLGRHAEALVHWQVLESLSPTRTAVWVNEAAALAALGNWDEARTAIEQALRLAPQDEVALGNALAIAERQRDQAARIAFLGALRAVQGQRFERHGQLADLLLEAGEVEAAIAVARATTPDARDRLPALIVLARAELQRQQPDAAQKALEEVNARMPQLLPRVLERHPELAAAWKGPPPTSDDGRR